MTVCSWASHYDVIVFVYMDGTNVILQLFLQGRLRFGLWHMPSMIHKNWLVFDVGGYWSSVLRHTIWFLMYVRNSEETWWLVPSLYLRATAFGVSRLPERTDTNVHM